VVLFGPGCSNPAAPGPLPPPEPGAPAIQCPADIQIDLVDEASAVVTYQAPVVSGGTAPVTATCTVPSGTTFQSGTADVICTATDAAARTSQCVFHVDVTLIPKLKGTKIVAFGDSITAGEVSAPSQPAVLYLDPASSYPSVLIESLRGRYRAQEITVINAGIPGERVLGTGSGDSGEGRIEDLVVQHRPDVLIILEGVNGLSKTNAIDISDGLRRGARRAVRQGVPLVLVSTILPGVPGRPKAPDPEAVLMLNEDIRAWVGREQVVLVDSFASFEPMKELLIGQDGLHPTVEGYTKLAEIFFEALKARFEAPPPAPAPAAPALLRRTSTRR
jgi:lysophospholipase L1-like esterase